MKNRMGLLAPLLAACTVDARGGLDGGAGADGGAVACGDDIVQPGEECEPTSPNTDACRADCQLPACGDGAVTPGDVCLEDGESLFPLASSHVVMKVADIDADGRDDLVMTRFDESSGKLLDVAFSDGSAGFSRVSVPYGGYARWDPLAVGDIDDDGDMDIVLASSDRIAVVRNGGGRALAADPAVEVRHGRPTGVAIGDVNGDRQPEIVTSNEDDETLSIIPYPGLPLGLDQRSVPVSAHSVALGDFDGDGVDDIVALGEDSLTFVFVSADNTFETRPMAGVATGARRLQLAEMNDDGRLDVLFVDQYIQGQTQYTATRVLVARGDRVTFDTHDLRGFAARAVADMDGDGRLDLIGLALASNRCATQYRCWHTETYLGDGDGWFGDRSYLAQFSPWPHESLLGSDGVTPQYLVAGDFDGDGAVDLAATTVEDWLFGANAVEVRIQRADP